MIEIQKITTAGLGTSYIQVAVTKHSFCRSAITFIAMHTAGPHWIAAVAPRWAAVGGTAWHGLCSHVSPVSDKGRKLLPQSCLCALHTDMALLAGDLSNLPLLFNPSQDHCYIDLYIGCRAAFIADVSLER